MNDEVVIRYRLTADEMVTGWRWYFRQLSPAFPYWGYWALTVVLVALSGFALWRGDRGSRLIYWVTLAVSAFWFCYVILFLVMMPWITRRQFARRPDRDHEVEWHISAETIRARMKIASTELVWAAIAKVVRTPEGFLLFPVEQIYVWLPRHGFASEEDYERLTLLAQQHALAFRRID